MIDSNIQKKKQIDDVIAKYNARMAIVKQKLDKIIFDFLKVVSEKRIAELRERLKKI